MTTKRKPMDWNWTILGDTQGSGLAFLVGTARTESGYLEVAYQVEPNGAYAPYGGEWLEPPATLLRDAAELAAALA